jgi:hypothetical protein
VRGLAFFGLAVLMDKDQNDAGNHTRTPYQSWNKQASQTAADRVHTTLRGPGGRARSSSKSGASPPRSGLVPTGVDIRLCPLHVSYSRSLHFPNRQNVVYAPAAAMGMT